MFFRLAAALLAAAVSTAAQTSPSEEQLRDGRSLYVANCMICHQITGLGTPGVFPPLARSDYLRDINQSILAVVQGLSGPITVNGKKYDGTMPPVNLNDDQVASLFTFVLNSWGNSGGIVSPQQVVAVRRNSRFPTYEALVQANSFASLPTPPDGLSLREVIRLPDHGIRLVGDGLGSGLYVLGGNGNVWHLDPVTSGYQQILWGKNYLEEKGVETSTWGFALDSKRQFYIVANRRDESGSLVSNKVTIYRTVGLENDHPSDPQPWFQTGYPWGVGPFNHCVNHIAFGPDGLLYVNSGSRTDGNEPGESPRYWSGGEHEITACLWRLDPAESSPRLEIFARGLRNAFGFCWDDQRRLFATDNGPDAHAPEELNHIEQGKHYGFPFQFSDWTTKPYGYTPTPPEGTTFIRPIINTGPGGGFHSTPVSTFDPHSSPAGIVQLKQDFPPPFAGSFLVARVGNLLKLDRDVGFDVLQVRLKDAHRAEVNTLLPGLGRPIDLFADGRGKVFILEYSRPTNNAGALGFPGRILELSVRSSQ